MHFLISFYRLKALTAHLCRVSCYSLCYKKKEKTKTKKTKKSSYIFRYLINFQFYYFLCLFVTFLIFYFILLFSSRYIHIKVSGDYEFYLI